LKWVEYPLGRGRVTPPEDYGKPFVEIKGKSQIEIGLIPWLYLNFP